MRNTKVGIGLAMLLTVGCVVSAQTDNPYESCVPGDNCTNGTECLSTSLPVSSGYTGNLCTNACNSTADCLQDLSSFSAVCVNGQCYLTCPTGGESCPYSQGCFTFDSNTGPISLCTP